MSMSVTVGTFASRRTVTSASSVIRRGFDREPVPLPVTVRRNLKVRSWPRTGASKRSLLLFAPISVSTTPVSSICSQL